MGIQEAIKQEINKQLRINRKLKRVFRGETQKKTKEFNSYYDFLVWKDQIEIIILGTSRKNGVLEITYI